MTTFQPADNLHSRTFLALLVAQFLAAFNDQAIHASAMFFAIHQQTLSKADAITLMPILFYAPWALFCTLAGYFADRYSKQFTLIFWKVAEVVICGVALGGFYLGTHGPTDHAGIFSRASGPWIVLSCVFLMGMHSAFFVPAKYGAMPEILTARMLSRGNGVLESLSFLAIILGTVTGGILSFYFHNREEVIGLILLTLAVVGALASFLIQKMPAANPTRPFPPLIYRPLIDSLRTLLSSRPLVLAIVGIAFFTFLVAFMRMTVYMHGESQVPRWTEMKTSLIVAVVALGIATGSPLVGYLSGGKVELGLVPIGALGMLATTVVAAALLTFVPGLVVCIVLIGFFTGFYLVPLYSLLQHRAPKKDKGDVIASSNFINVIGAIVSSLLFGALVWLAHHTTVAPPLEQVEVARGILAHLDADEYRTRFHYLEVSREDQPAFRVGQPGEAPPIDPLGGLFESENGEVVDQQGAPLILEAEEKGGILEPGAEVVVTRYQRTDPRGRTIAYYRVRSAQSPERQVFEDERLPSLLFLGVGFTTLVTLMILWGQLPDLFFRTWLWFHIHRRARLEIGGMHHLPPRGPVLLVTDAVGAESSLQVLSATDRTTRFLFVQEPGEPNLPRHIRAVARRRHLAYLPLTEEEAPVWLTIRDRARRALARGEAVGLTLGGRRSEQIEQLLADLLTHPAGPVVVPVHYATEGRARIQEVYVLAGSALPAGTDLESIRAALGQLRAEFKELTQKGIPLAQALAGSH
jgi:MFS family permease